MLEPGLFEASIISSSSSRTVSNGRTQFQPAVLIDPQKMDGGSANRRAPRDHPVLIQKMLVPAVEPWMKQSGQLTGSGDPARRGSALVEIAVVTGEGEVLRRIRAAMLAGDDGFDVEEQRLLLLQRPAILATPVGPLPDKLAERGVHHATLTWANTRRALP